jgi:hypothetical protein
VRLVGGDVRLVGGDGELVEDRSPAVATLATGGDVGDR